MKMVNLSTFCCVYKNYSNNCAGKAATSISRTVSIEAVRRHVQPIPENPHHPVIQKVFADIREKNANFILMQNGTEISTDFKVIPVTV